MLPLQGARGLQKVLAFTVSVPGKLIAFARLPSAERKEIYKGWWNSAKEEGRHYWVRSQGCRGEISITDALAALFRI